jgi:nitroreductase
MDTIEAILGRKVQRTFSDKPVEADKLSKIVDAGRHAMSARNLQPWQFIVVRDR